MQTGDYSSVRVTESQTEITSKWKNNKPAIHVGIKAEGYLEGTQCYKSVDKLGTIEKYEKLVNKVLSQEISNSISHVQSQYESDIYGFGEAMRRQDYDSFMKIKDKWDQEFSKADIKVDVDFVLRRSGIRSKSFLTGTEK